VTETADILSPEDWLFSALLDMVIAHCQTSENRLDSSVGWPAHQNAMRLLAEAGLIQIKSDLDERILAEVLPAAGALTACIETARRGGSRCRAYRTFDAIAQKIAAAPINDPRDP
jgi:hypothetical protein